MVALRTAKQRRHVTWSMAEDEVEDDFLLQAIFQIINTIQY